MLPVARALLLLCAAMLCVGSARRSPQVAQRRVLAEKPDKQLRHPALHVVNRSGEVVRLAFRGPVRRQLITPPQEHVRTLLAAGVYKMVVQRGEQVLRRQKVRLKKGHRYRMEIAP